MALSTELLKKFKLKDVPLPKKLFAAKVLFTHSEFCYVSRKEELVLDWLLELAGHELTYDVWQTIQICLQSENMSKLKVVDIKSETKETLIKLFIQSLESQVHAEDPKKSKNSLDVGDINCLIRECSILTVQNSVFLYYFRKNIDKYITLSCLILKSAAENGDVETFIKYIKSVECFCDQSQKRDDLFKVFIEKILLPVVETFCSLKKFLNTVPSNDQKLEVDIPCIDNSVTIQKVDNLKTELVHIIGQVICPYFLHRSLKTGLKHLFENRSIDSSVLHVLCQFLMKHASSRSEVTINLYAFIFESFVLKFQNDFNTIYQFFVTLCLLLGFETRIENETDDDETCLLTKDVMSKALGNKICKPEEEISLLALTEMITTLKKSVLVLDESINEISFKQWMQALAIDLVSTCHTPSITYNILNAIIELNPLIIAPIINKVLTNMLLKPKATPEEKKQYKMLFHGMFKMFVKLNQLQSFIRLNLLPTLKDVIKENRLQDNDMLDIPVCDVIPDGFASAFGSAVGTFYGQSCELLRVFNNVLTQYVIVPMEKGHVDGGHRLLLGVLENLFVPFLGGIRMAEQTVMETTCVKFLKYLMQLRTCLGRLGITLIQLEHCSKMLASFLHLCLAVGELQLLLLLYSPWGSQNEHLQVLQSVNPECATDLQCLLSFLDHQQWNDIAQRVSNLGDDACQESLYALLQQQLRVLVIFENNIENSKEMQSTVCEYLIESLIDIQLLQKKDDAAVLVPLLSHEKLISIVENITEYLTVNELNSEVLDLLKDPVLAENKTLLVCIAWKTMQRIGNVLSKRKRTHDCDSIKLNHRRLVKDMCLSVDYSDVLCSAERDKLQESFLEIAQKINEACKDILQGDKTETDGMPLDLVKLSRHLVLMRSLPLPFLPQSTQTFWALGTVGVIIVLSELSKKCSSTSGSGGNAAQYTSASNLCREILLGLLDGPTPASLLDCVDVGLLVQFLHQDGQCPKLLLQLIFQDCIKKPQHLHNLAEAVCVVDDYVKQINTDAFPIAAFLLQLLLEKNLSSVSGETRATYKKSIQHLLNVVSQRIVHQMKSENVSEASVLSLLTACWCVLSSHSVELFKMVVPHVERFLSCAFSVLENPDVHLDVVPMAERLLEIVIRSHMRIGKGISERALWKAHKSLNRPQLIARLLKDAAAEDFKRVLQDLCHPLKAGSDKEFPDLRLPRSLVTTPMLESKAVFVEQMALLVSSSAFKMITQGDSNDKMPEFLDFLYAIAKRTKVPLPYELADIILTTIVCALKIQPMSRDYVLTTNTTASQLLSKMVLHHFPLIKDRVPAFMLTYRMIVHTIVINSATELQLQDQEAEKLAKCAHEIEQLSKSLANHSQVFKAVSQHMVADMLQEFEQTAMHHRVKFHIMNALYALMDLCDRFAFAHLSYALPSASLELFKTVMSSYNKFYKYTGKV